MKNEKPAHRSNQDIHDLTFSYVIRLLLRFAQKRLNIVIEYRSKSFEIQPSMRKEFN